MCPTRRGKLNLDVLEADMSKSSAGPTGWKGHMRGRRCFCPAVLGYVKIRRSPVSRGLFPARPALPNCRAQATGYMRKSRATSRPLCGAFSERLVKGKPAVRGVTPRTWLRGVCLKHAPNPICPCTSVPKAYNGENLQTSGGLSMPKRTISSRS